MQICFISFRIQMFTLDGVSVFRLPENPQDCPIPRENCLILSDLSEHDLWALPISDHFPIQSRHYFPCLPHVSINNSDELLSTFHDVKKVLLWLNQAFPTPNFLRYHRASLAVRNTNTFNNIHAFAHSEMPNLEPNVLLPDFRVTMKRHIVFGQDEKKPNATILLKNAFSPLLHQRFPTGGMERIIHSNFFTAANVLGNNAPTWVNVEQIKPIVEMNKRIQAALQSAFTTYWHTKPLLREWLSWDESQALKKIAHFKINHGAVASAWSDETIGAFFRLPEKIWENDFLNALAFAIITGAVMDFDENTPVMNNHLPFSGLVHGRLMNKPLSLAVLLSNIRHLSVCRVHYWGVEFAIPSQLNRNRQPVIDTLNEFVADHDVCLLV